MTDKRKDLMTMDEAREAYDNATIQAHAKMFGEGVDASMVADTAFAALREAILTAARQSDAAARIAAQREGWDAAQAFICGPAIAGAVLDAERDRLYPLPTRECVLSDGSRVRWEAAAFHWSRIGAVTKVSGTWWGLITGTDTGADFDALKSFAAGVGR